MQASSNLTSSHSKLRDAVLDRLQVRGLINRSDAGESTTELHRQSTHHLQLAVSGWHSSFFQLTKHHRDYIHSLHSWLRLTLYRLDDSKENGSKGIVPAASESASKIYCWKSTCLSEANPQKSISPLYYAAGGFTPQSHSAAKDAAGGFTPQSHSAAKAPTVVSEPGLSNSACDKYPLKRLSGSLCRRDRARSKGSNYGPRGEGEIVLFP
ncbi:hypothetical protein EJ110_NYTH54532 [Nymphaea thermarum]|nr:hypothetical protein EJ110_NYTH54532 [Nymphaea thermarum]